MSVEESTVLSSWKDIARYLGKGVRTVQRWERDLGLPVRRPIGASQKSAVVLHRGDVDAWLATRFSARTSANERVVLGSASTGSGRADLQARIQRARELRRTHQILTQQLTDALRRLTEKCDLLNTQTKQRTLLPGPAVVMTVLPQAGSLTNEKIA